MNRQAVHHLSLLNSILGPLNRGFCETAARRIGAPGLRKIVALVELQAAAADATLFLLLSLSDS